jgi:hypothetical protein
MRYTYRSLKFQADITNHPANALANGLETRELQPSIGPTSGAPASTASLHPPGQSQANGKQKGNILLYYAHLR